MTSAPDARLVPRVLLAAGVSGLGVGWLVHRLLDATDLAAVPSVVLASGAGSAAALAMYVRQGGQGSGRWRAVWERRPWLTALLCAVVMTVPATVPLVTGELPAPSAWAISVAVVGALTVWMHHLLDPRRRRPGS